MRTQTYAMLVTVLAALLGAGCEAAGGGSSAGDPADEGAASDSLGKRDSLLGDVPELSVAPDDNTPLELVAAAANSKLTDGRRVRFENLVVEPAVPDLADVLTAYGYHVREEGIEDLGPVEDAELTDALAAYHFSGAIEAAEEIAGDDAYAAGKMFLVTEPAPSAPQWETFYLLYFRGAARVIVLDLVAYEV